MNEQTIPITTSKRLAAEFLGTAFLLAVVVGSGIMAQNLSGGNTAIALLANTIATGAGLIALILMFGEISGAHFNPAVSMMATLQKEISVQLFLLYVVAQIAGAFAGVAAAHAMVDLPSFFASTHVRTGASQWWSEFIATFGLIAVIISTSRTRPATTPFAVAAYITAAYWFTSSTSFANPAVSLARAASDTFAGIRPIDAPGFIVAQLAGAIVALLVFNWFYPRKNTSTN
ncbi:MAG: aquaporin family protein [Burkholderiaceae bacterium]|nr:MAG: aquaporin family protein [Burkholderiaceae bacterium]